MKIDEVISSLPQSDAYRASVQAAIVNPETACWTATKGVNKKNGYASVYLGGGKKAYCHRLALEYKLGRKIADGMVAMHACDNPACMNPDHLSEGTLQDNADDMVRKGRQQKSFQHAHSKLTEDQIRGFFEKKADGWTHQQIADLYGTRPATVGGILTGSQRKYDALDVPRIAKRAMKGEDHPMAKLTDDQAMEIRKRYAGGETSESICVDYGVSRSLADMIGRGDIFKHLPMPETTSKLREAKIKGRPSAKLTDDDVREIRRLRATGLTQTQVGNMFGVCFQAISKIDRRKTFAEVV